MEGWSQDFVEVNNLHLHCIRTGIGDKPALLLLHGLTDNGRYWSRTAAALEDLYDVCMLDQRGHGLSERPASGYSDEEMAADATKVIEALHLAPAAVLGHSMGGAVTIVLAGKRPDLVARALLLDPALNQTGKTSDAQPTDRREDWYQCNLAAKQLSEAELAWRCGQQHPEWDAADCGYWAESNLQVDPEAIRQFHVHRPWQETIPQIQCPTLLIHGEKARGSIVGDVLAAEITSAVPTVKAARIANAGHSIQRTRFPAYIAAVRGLLS
jgi:pimeloyl-ACP methyl ester carboxylesterase